MAGKIDIAERKYSHIAESSNDLIFLLNEEAVVMRMNAASRKVLGFRPEEMTGEPFYSFIADGPEISTDIHRTTFRENLQRLRDGDAPVRFRTVLRMKQIIAGMKMELSLQKNIIGGQVEILAKSTTIYPEASELFLSRERGTYLISSNISEGEIITRGLITRLGRFFDHIELKKFQVGLGEILLNAIEHGNLGISFDEKSEAILGGDYMAFLLKRQKDPKYAHRKVRIDFILDAKKILFRITDAGAGFDHVSYLKKVATDDSMLELEHGRGILMAKNIFDRIIYNQKGNQILLIKYR